MERIGRAWQSAQRRGRPLAHRLLCLLAVLLFAGAPQASASRLKDLATVQGVRPNQLVGYGLVVGLNGTGDGNNAAFTTQGVVNLMRNMGVKVNPNAIKVKNVASVIVTAKLPPFVKVGQTIDVTLSSVGDAASLQGGTLLATPLKGLDNRVYAIAQGPVSIGGFEVQGGETAGRQKNHLTVARIPSGATVEREVGVSFLGKQTFTISLNAPDFTTVSRLVKAVNTFLQGDFATARDGATVEVRLPPQYRQQPVSFLAALENLELTPDAPAKVVLDERTGTVVMGEKVRIGELALAHGNLSLQITAAQPAAPAGGPPSPPSGNPQPGPRKAVTGDKGQKLVQMPAGATLGEVVRALNSVGVAPRDLIAIFQSIKAAGALRAELEII